MERFGKIAGEIDSAKLHEARNVAFTTKRNSSIRRRIKPLMQTSGTQFYRASLAARRTANSSSKIYPLIRIHRKRIRVYADEWRVVKS